jgi:hypothetical protein
LILAASSARFLCHSSYSTVPRLGGTSLGIPPSHVGTLSATTPLVEAQADRNREATVASAATVGFMMANTRPNHV